MKERFIFQLKFLRLTPEHTIRDFCLLENPDVFSVQDSSLDQRLGVGVPYSFQSLGTVWAGSL